MEINYSIFLVITVTSLATFLSRFLGALTSEQLNANSKIFHWFNCIAYSVLAALLSRLIIFPAGILSESDIFIRFIVLVICLAIFLFSKNNLVIPTILSAVILSFLSGIN